MKPLDLHPGSIVKVVGMNDTSLLTPNHHAHYPGFSGLRGWLAALSMLRRRGGTVDLAIRLTDLSEGSRLVDVGCGPGVAARLAARSGAIVTGVDPAPVMLRVAGMADRSGAVSWRLGVAEALPLRDGSQDIAWALATVHHWPDLTGGLAEVRRVLVPGGHFVAVERRISPDATGHASHGWTTAQAEQFAEMCSSARFGEVGISTHETERGVVIAVLAHSTV